MSKCRIFVSSTCFDLAAVREDLRSHILGLGHEPLLSEYPSFPVDPDADCITNCQRNVREHTDLLVLIVGGRRGYLDEKSRKTVTNLEYETARAGGLPVFVFVSRSVQQLLSVWRKNPTADFTPAVDHPEVFQFLERIYQENRWVFTFEKTAEIAETLTTQLSVMFRDLLGRSRAGTLQPFGQFLAISEKAEKLAREKPEYWEYLLTAELLSVQLADVRYRADRVRNGQKHIKPKSVSGKELLGQMQMSCSELINWVAVCRTQISRITESWGPHGQPGDAQQILRSVRELIELCDHLVRWEEDLAALSPPIGLLRLKSLMQGWTEFALKELESLPKQLLAPFAGGAKPTGEHLIELKFNFPSLDWTAELEHLKANPNMLRELAN